MSRYFSKIEQTYTAKNTLQKAIIESCEPLANFVIYDSYQAVEDAKLHLRNHVEKLCLQHKRCKELQFRSWKCEEHTTVMRIEDVIQINFYKAKN